MLKELSEKELKKTVLNNSFFDFKDLKTKYGYCYKIRFGDSEDVITYSDLQFGAKKELYEKYEQIIVEIMIKITNLFNAQQGVVAKYNEKWIVNKEKSEWLWNKMCIQKISNYFKGGFSIIDQSFVAIVTREILKYNCFALFIFDGCVIAPSDHMDIFIWFFDDKLKNKIDIILRTYSNKNLILEDLSSRYQV